MNKYRVPEEAMKYYDSLHKMINDIAQYRLGGEEITLSFPVGKVTIKLNEYENSD